uniref:Elongation of fatty acids protein n=1 Tax=Pinguiococcus pyrenoidosus TaxID=172671 RepID=A0A7R9UBB9_9STRA
MCKTAEAQVVPASSSPAVLRWGLVALLGAACVLWWQGIVESGGPGRPHEHHVPTMGVLAYLIVCLVALNAGEERVKQLWKGLGLDPKATLKETMIVYNVGQVLVNAWMVYAVLQPLATGALPVLDTFVPLQNSQAASYALWIHYCDKYLEFLDTLFMLLRGNFKQVTFLHVYHHGTIAFAWHVATYLAWRGDAYFGVLLNSAIHVMMYSYYTLTLMGISCPWKKYLTKMQLAQFVTVILYTLTVIVTRTINGTHDFWFYLAAGVQIFEMSSLYFLFSAFYAKAYKKKTA